ncbi:MAG TPA: hypothetical protein VHU84_11020, partial [Lacipirellulaceae bacterium]|nr:hypothetical protein [Lacipirellulaceae bacterium]
QLDQPIEGRDTGDRPSILTNSRNNALRDNSRSNRDSFSINAERTRNDWSRRDRDKLPFRYGWWDSFARDRWPGYGPWGYSNYRNRPYYWWGWTAAGPLSNWFPFGWDRPRYWGYGPGANIYYQDDYVYYDGDRYLPVNDYYQRIYNLAHSVPPISQGEAEKMDWMPLGVFAVTRGDNVNQRDEADQRSIQLAVNKEGVISGTFYNDKNNQAHPVTGMVDEHNQRAAWAFADGDHPKLVFETSVFNLTKPESTMMVHYGPSSADTEVWHLVRLEQPEGGNPNVNAQRQPAGNDLP